MVFNLVFFFNQLLAQCPKFPNGDMEELSIDSFIYVNSFVYYYKAKGWSSFNCFTLGSPDRNDPDSCTCTGSSYEGKTALWVPLDNWTLTTYEALLADTINGIPSSLTGYYNIVGASDLAYLDMHIFFHDTPLKFRYQLDSLDSLEDMAYYFKKLKSTSGSYMPFEIKFDSRLEDFDSFLVFIYADVDSMGVDDFPGLYLDNLEFTCPVNLQKDQDNNYFKLELFSNANWIIKSEMEFEPAQYMVYNLNGQLISSGVFYGSVTFEKTSELKLVKVFNSKTVQTFKI